MPCTCSGVTCTDGFYLPWPNGLGQGLSLACLCLQGDVQQEPVVVHRLQLFMPMQLGGEAGEVPSFAHTG